MGLGALGAWVYLRKASWLKIIFTLPAQLIVYAMALLHVATTVTYGKFTVWVFCLVYLTIIMNVALNPKSLLKLENRFFRYMGEISYGFYVFHWLVIVICINTLGALGGIEHEFTRNVVLLIATFGLTTIFASLSYYLWERRFLKLKAKCTALATGLMAKESPAIP